MKTFLELFAFLFIFSLICFSPLCLIIRFSHTNNAFLHIHNKLCWKLFIVWIYFKFKATFQSLFSAYSVDETCCPSFSNSFEVLFPDLIWIPHYFFLLECNIISIILFYSFCFTLKIWSYSSSFFLLYSRRTNELVTRPISIIVGKNHFVP